MANKKDTFVKGATLDAELAEIVANLGDPLLIVHRSANDNDGAQYKYGEFYRVCESREAAIKLVKRIDKQRYMGPKRLQWVLQVPVWQVMTPEGVSLGRGNDSDGEVMRLYLREKAAGRAAIAYTNGVVVAVNEVKQ